MVVEEGAAGAVVDPVTGAANGALTDFAGGADVLEPTGGGAVEGEPAAGGASFAGAGVST